MRFFVRWRGRNGVMRHRRDMGAAECEALLKMLANERQISPSTHNHALSALPFLWLEVVAVGLPHALEKEYQKAAIPGAGSGCCHCPHFKVAVGGTASLLGALLEPH